jgi:hypothetical protein
LILFILLRFVLFLQRVCFGRIISFVPIFFRRVSRSKTYRGIYFLNWIEFLFSFIFVCWFCGGVSYDIFYSIFAEIVLCLLISVVCFFFYKLLICEVSLFVVINIVGFLFVYRLSFFILFSVLLGSLSFYSNL